MNPETLAPSMSRQRLWAMIAIAHLALVALGAASFDWSEHGGEVGQALDHYGLLSGAGYSYGFFAPGISGQLRVLVDLQDAAGKTRTVSLADGASHEAEIRIGDIIEQFTDAEIGDRVDDRERFQRSLAASLALTAFERFPRSQQVTIRLEHFNPVSMADFRQGKRSGWQSLYQASFRYNRRSGASS